MTLVKTDTWATTISKTPSKVTSMFCHCWKTHSKVTSYFLKYLTVPCDLLGNFLKFNTSLLKSMFSSPSPTQPSPPSSQPAQPPSSLCPAQPSQPSSPSSLPLPSSALLPPLSSLLPHRISWNMMEYRGIPSIIDYHGIMSPWGPPKAPKTALRPPDFTKASRRLAEG